MPLRAALALLLAAGCSKPPAPPATPPVSRAADFLASKQGADGLWKSGTSTVLSSGQALTPFVLYALSHAPADVVARHRAAIDRGLAQLPVEGNEYPSYSLALAILALRRLRPQADTAPLAKRLRALQLTEANGWSEADPEYGGWDQGLIPPKKPQCQRPDVSVTAFAAEALGGDAKAVKFAGRCRAKEGGYFFTPNATWQHQNKAGAGKGYATASADAFRILEAADSKSKPGGAFLLQDEEPAWHRLPDAYAEALFFYHAFARSKVAPDASIAQAVAARQQPDGSFQNPNGLMKEDDPLVATGLALVALALSGPR